MNNDKKTSDTESVPGANPALQTRNYGSGIRREPAALTPSGNPVGFYPYSTFVGGRQPEPKAPGEAKPEHKPADLTKLKPATVKCRETVITPERHLTTEAAALGCCPGKMILEGPALDAAVGVPPTGTVKPKPNRPWAQKG